SEILAERGRPEEDDLRAALLRRGRDGSCPAGRVVARERVVPREQHLLRARLAERGEAGVRRSAVDADHRAAERRRETLRLAERLFRDRADLLVSLLDVDENAHETASRSSLMMLTGPSPLRAARGSAPAPRRRLRRRCGRPRAAAAARTSGARGSAPGSARLAP